MIKFKNPILIILISTLVFAILSPFFISRPNSASADIEDFLIGGVSCIAGGSLANWLTGYINKGLSRLRGLLSQRIESWLGLTNTVPVIDQEAFTKERVYDLIARCFAREILNEMTARTIGTVRT